MRLVDEWSYRSRIQGYLMNIQNGYKDNKVKIAVYNLVNGTIALNKNQEKI